MDKIKLILAVVLGGSAVFAAPYIVEWLDLVISVMGNDFSEPAVRLLLGIACSGTVLSMFKSGSSGSGLFGGLMGGS